MIFDEKDRRAGLYITAKRLQNVDSATTVKAMCNLNQAALKVCIASLKKENPSINDERLLQELKRIYSL